jgi:regulator of sigma D
MQIGTPEFILGILGSGALTAFVTNYYTKKKTNADAGLSEANSAKVFVDIAKELTLKMAEDNKKTQEELNSVYNELEAARQTIVDLQSRVEERTKAHSSCMELVVQLQKQIDERDAPDKRGGREPHQGR